VDFEDGAVKLIQSFQQFIVAGDADVVAFRIGPRQLDVLGGDGGEYLAQFLDEVRVTGGDVLVQREAADLHRLLLPAPPVQERLHGEGHIWR
jgi:hypothetical protein